MDPAPEIVLAYNGGGLLALGLDGKPLWNTGLGSEESRGLDDAVIQSQRYLAAANHDGSLAVYDEKGQIVWQNNPGQIRRMRAFDLDGNGTSEIITGGSGILFLVGTGELEANEEAYEEFFESIEKIETKAAE